MMRKLIEWTIFGIAAIGLLLFVRWSLPRVVRIGVATGIVKIPPARIDPALRKHLRQEEDRLAKATPAALHGQPGNHPCLVLPVEEGVGEKPHRRGSALPRGGRRQPAKPFRDCLQLVPGGGPVNAAELSPQTGMVLFVQTDLYLPGDPPIAFTRVVMPQVIWNWQPQNQTYLPSEYITYPTGHRYPYTDQKLWLADGSGIQFNRISQGTGYADAVYKHSGPGSLFYNALVGWNGNGWDYDLPDGRTLVFPDSYYARRPEQGSMVGLIAPSGASLKLERDRRGDLHEVRASDGRWMKFDYRGPLVVSIEDSAGDKATYSYDKQDRLSTSTNAAGETLAYNYNASGGLTKVENKATRKPALSAGYNLQGPTSLQVDGGRTYNLANDLDAKDGRGHQ